MFLLFLVLEFSVGIGGFVIGLSQISFFFSLIQSVWLYKKVLAQYHQNNTCTETHVNCWRVKVTLFNYLINIPISLLVTANQNTSFFRKKVMETGHSKKIVTMQPLIKVKNAKLMFASRKRFYLVLQSITCDLAWYIVLVEQRTIFNQVTIFRPLFLNFCNFFVSHRNRLLFNTNNVIQIRFNFNQAD